MNVMLSDVINCVNWGRISPLSFDVGIVPMIGKNQEWARDLSGRDRDETEKLSTLSETRPRRDVSTSRDHIPGKNMYVLVQMWKTMRVQRMFICTTDKQRATDPLCMTSPQTQFLPVADFGLTKVGWRRFNSNRCQRR